MDLYTNQNELQIIEILQKDGICLVEWIDETNTWEKLSNLKEL